MRREKFLIISALLLIIALEMRATQYIVVNDVFFGLMLGVSTQNLFTYSLTKIMELLEEGDAE